jgi:hypothetical protein
MVIAHAVFSVVGFALLLPSGVLVARYLRTFSPAWYTGHWIAQFGIGMVVLRDVLPTTDPCPTAGPAIVVGIVLGFKAAGPIGYKIMDDHKASHNPHPLLIF